MSEHRAHDKYSRYPFRPTDHSPKVPIHVEDRETVSRLAAFYNRPWRRVTAQKVAKNIPREELHECAAAIDFLSEHKLNDVWHARTQEGRENFFNQIKSNSIIIECSNGREGSQFLQESSTALGFIYNILAAGTLPSYWYIVIQADALNDQQKTALKQAAKKHGFAIDDSLEKFRQSKEDHIAVTEPNLLEQCASRNLHRLRYSISIADQPYFYHLINRFDNEWAVVHSIVIGSHGYLDVELTNPNAKTQDLLSFAKHTGLSVRPLTRNDFWDDLAFDCEEELRRTLATQLGRKGNDWECLPEKYDVPIEAALSRFKEQYESFRDPSAAFRWIQNDVTLNIADSLADTVGPRKDKIIPFHKKATVV